ncbi:hypothetical protein LEMLEM_LOCUS10687, partial [Lemmus lemmus]
MSCVTSRVPLQSLLHSLNQLSLESTPALTVMYCSPHSKWPGNLGKAHLVLLK